MKNKARCNHLSNVGNLIPHFTTFGDFTAFNKFTTFNKTGIPINGKRGLF
jgi:hypothetical protein